MPSTPQSKVRTQFEAKRARAAHVYPTSACNTFATSSLPYKHTLLKLFIALASLWCYCGPAPYDSSRPFASPHRHQSDGFPPPLFSSPVGFAEASPGNCSSSSSAAVDTDLNNHKVITLGYLRMTGLDDSAILVSFLSAIREANLQNNKKRRLLKQLGAMGGVPSAQKSATLMNAPDLGFTFKLDVVTIDCPDTAACEASIASIDKAYVTPTIVKLARRAAAVTIDTNMFVDDGGSPSNASTSPSLAAALAVVDHFKASGDPTIPSTTLPALPTTAASPTNGEALMLAFFARMPYYSAIMRPNHLIAPRIIEHVRRIGNARNEILLNITNGGLGAANSTGGAAGSPYLSAALQRILTGNASISVPDDEYSVFGSPIASASGQFIPIISPISIAKADLEPQSENIIHFEHYIGYQLAHLFTFMQQSSACAFSGVVYQQFSEMADHVAGVQDMFVQGHLPKPPALDIDTATDGELLEFFLGEERRRCFVVLATALQLQNTVERLVRLSNGSYVPQENKFFGTSLIATNKFMLSNGDTTAFDVHYTRWSPPYRAADPEYQFEAAKGLKKVFTQWLRYIYGAEVVAAVDAGLSVNGITAASGYPTLETVPNVEMLRSFESGVPLTTDGTGPTAANGFDLTGFSSIYPGIDVISTVPTNIMFSSYLVICNTLEAIKSAVSRRIGAASLTPRSAQSPIAAGNNNTLAVDADGDGQLDIFEDNNASYMLYNSSEVFNNDVNWDGSSVAAASTSASSANGSVDYFLPVTIPYEAVVRIFYDETRAIGGYSFNRLQRQCSSKPQADGCFCNTLPRTSFMHYVSPAMGGVPQIIFDNPARGERNLASIAFARSCSYAVSSWSYPITALFLFPEVAAEPLLATIFEQTFAEMIRSSNYAPSAPARPFRYAPFDVAATDSTARVLASYTDSFRPFVIFGSLESVIHDASVLTLFPTVRFRTEDPVLKPMAGANSTARSPQGNDTESPFWQPNLLNLFPVLADYIAAMAKYYVDNRDVLFNGYGGPFCIATTQREAELISLSFGSLGVLVPVESVVVSQDPGRWLENVSAWLSSAHPSGITFTTSATVTKTVYGPGGAVSAKTEVVTTRRYRLPFVLAATTLNPNEVINTVWAAAKRIDRGVLAVAAFDSTIYNSTIAAESIATDKNETSFDTNGSAADADFSSPQTEAAIASRLADIVFSAVAPEWWVDGSRRYRNIPEALAPYRLNPRFLTALIASEFMQTLAASVQNDYVSTAADILYTTAPSVTTRAGTFGPFSNVTCSDEKIAANAHDRTCQCTKGPRTFFVHSLKDRELGQSSIRTGQFSHTISTCGVVYTPYVPPPPPGFSLSSSAIAGIAVGCSLFVAGLVATGILVNILCFGRNNRAAPKDSTKPFTIVFTDIQSSTALWARAPNAMSEAVEDHHAILRKCLRRNDGYEVKTVGDSFMVAFKEADDAVRFALETQLMLKDAWCWSSEIDAIYIELLAEAESEETANATNNLTFKDTTNDAGSSARNSNVGNTAFGSQRSSTVVEVFRGAKSVTTSSQHTSMVKTNSQNNLCRGPRANPTNAAAAVLQDGRAAGSSLYNHCTSVTCPNEVSETPEAAPVVSGVVTLLGVSGVVASCAGEASADTDSDRGFGFVQLNTSARKKSLQSPADQSLQPPSRTAADQKPSYSAASLTMPNKVTAATRVQSIGTLATAPTNFTSDSFSHKQWWHGLRVRIGVHYGMGDIRKDPVSLGYDYYGTVVNTAARVEGVGHGGQILITDDAFNALSDGFMRKHSAIAVALGPQPLRGLDEPIRLHQVVPQRLDGRRFPPLRLHIEKETEDTDLTTETATTSTGDNLTPEALVARLCATRQYQDITADSLLQQYYFFLACFAPTTPKYRASVVAKLGEVWGFEKASKAANVANEGLRTRLLVNMLGKIVKTFRASKKARGARGASNRGASASAGGDSISGIGTVINGSLLQVIGYAETASCGHQYHVSDGNAHTYTSCSRSQSSAHASRHHHPNDSLRHFLPDADPSKFARRSSSASSAKV